MAGDKYIISDQYATYYLTSTVIHWIDLFTRREYKDIVVDSLSYCAKEKNLIINAWVIMSNHLHLVARCEAPTGMSAFLRDFKKFTSKSFIDKIELIHESRKEWLLDKFSFEARRTQRAENHKVWMDSNHAVDLSAINAMEKVNYIHENPVRAGLVFYPDQYPYSSAIDYSGGKGLIPVEVL